MKPAERVALLKALIAGATVELKAAESETLALAEAVGVKTFTTSYGQVTVAARDAQVYVASEHVFLEWVKEAHPDQVQTIVQPYPMFVAGLLSRVEFSVEVGEYVDKETGEVVPGLARSLPGDPYITWPSGAEQKATKAEASEWFRERAEALLDGMARIEARP